MSNILYSVRRITLLLFALAVCAGFFVGKLSSDQFMSLATVIIAFYFGQESKTPTGDEPVAGIKQNGQ